MAASRRKFVIDCDPGTDDAQAILMILAQSDIELLAVTTVFGNTHLENTSVNALRVLKLCQRLDVTIDISHKYSNLKNTMDGSQVC